MRQGDWSACANHLADAARKIEAGGADALLICTNTMHSMKDQQVNRRGEINSG